METHVLYDRLGVFKRVAVIDSETLDIVIIMYNVLYTTVTGEPGKIRAVDPDGGPFIHVNTQIGSWVIESILGYTELDQGDDDEDEKTVFVKGKVKRAPSDEST